MNAAAVKTAGQAPITRPRMWDAMNAPSPQAPRNGGGPAAVAPRPGDQTPDPEDRQDEAAERARAGRDGDAEAGDQAAGGDRGGGKLGHDSKPTASVRNIAPTSGTGLTIPKRFSQVAQARSRV